MNEPVFSEAIPDLLTTHYSHLTKSSSISPDVIKQRGYRSLLGKSELVKLGFTPAQRHVPGYLFPYGESMAMTSLATISGQTIQAQ